MEPDYPEYQKPIHLLTEDERMRAIGDLLATAAIRYLRRQDREHLNGPKPIQARTEVWDLVDDEIEKQVLRYLAQNITAIPSVIGKALNIHSKALERRLARLRSLGLVTVSGKTRNAYYSLTTDTSQN